MTTKNCALRPEVWDKVFIEQGKTPHRTFSMIVDGYISKVQNFESKMQEFSNQYGAENVEGSFDGDLSVEAIRQNMARRLIFRAAAFINLKPEMIFIKDKDGNVLSIS